LAKIRSGDCDAISFGQFYVSNPDLAERILNKLPVKLGDKATYYGNAHGSKGYTDYPLYQP
jgi:N-ethylmaleimide reductase